MREWWNGEIVSFLVCEVTDSEPRLKRGQWLWESGSVVELIGSVDPCIREWGLELD